MVRRLEERRDGQRTEAEAAVVAALAVVEDVFAP
jgi:hypothetical protein